MLAKPLFNALLFLGCLACSWPALADDCSDLGALALSHISITATETKAAATFKPARGAALALPAHCRIAAVLSPSDDSRIAMELWLPTQWNGKFLALGNGGWAGSISFSAMAIGLQAGYAVASNDTGHQGGSAAFALGHPEKLVDFAYRSMHAMAVQSKAIISAFYKRGPDLSYYQGCSTGGRQGLMEAQRYPADFDAIIAGAPVYNQNALHASQMHKLISIIKDDSLFLPPDKIQLLHAAILASCESQDGVADGFFNNPLACHFEPATLLCRGSGTEACLSAAQLDTVRSVYAPATTAAGVEIYPGHATGFELAWRMPAPGSTPPALASDTFSYIAHEDAAWDWQNFDLASDYALAREKAAFVDATDLDLSEFKARGGKLLLYHGWNDPGPSPLNTINYYEGVRQTLGGEQSDWMRLYLMPGMGHCQGGIGPDQADFLGALASWREAGVAPEQITAARIREGRVDMTRPLCPYPAVATWDGQGNPDDAASYSCQESDREE
ncbi:MAG: tannase/feruloyl esterase family alpha/beta hydrolase [Pseudomonadales bacterium]|nr:tannase/feruloyl esterase family alpha/beta hydrolase [Pseudomonadales bacterium]